MGQGREHPPVWVECEVGDAGGPVECTFKGYQVMEEDLVSLDLQKTIDTSQIDSREWLNCSDCDR